MLAVKTNEKTKRTLYRNSICAQLVAYCSFSGLSSENLILLQTLFYLCLFKHENKDENHLSVVRDYSRNFADNLVLTLDISTPQVFQLSFLSNLYLYYELIAQLVYVLLVFKCIKQFFCFIHMQIDLRSRNINVHTYV